LADKDKAELDAAGPVAVGSAGSLAVPVSLFLVFAGSAMQSYTNGTFDGPFVALLFLMSGYLAIKLVFSSGRAELRAFLLTYGVCVFVGGLAQCYSLATFGSLQSTRDAVAFFGAVFPKPPYYTWRDLNYLWIDGSPVGGGAPLAVAVWQAVYHVRHILGMDYGLYVGVMFNALVMGMTAAVTVRTAREIFGDDAWRLRRVGTLFAFCGLFILFGSVLLRDCFTTFFNALVLWGIIRWLCRPSSRNLLFATVLTGISVGAMAYLRSRSIVLFGLYWVLALVCWFLAKRLNLTRVLVSFLIVLALMAGSTYLLDYVRISEALQSEHMTRYETFQADASGQDSIAMRVIVSQPMPIRLVLGTGSLMVCPIPLWAFFLPNDSLHYQYDKVDDYHLIKGYHGIYQVLVMPLVLAGFVAVVLLFRKDRKQAIPLVLLAIYVVMSVLAVVATSLEQRHVAQFMPAFMILAAAPDTWDKETRKRVCEIAIAWVFLVILVHLAWAIVAMAR